MYEILFALWFFLPAGLANASPVFASHIKFLKPLYKPIDFGKSFRKHRIFGENKTWLGLVAGVLVGLGVIAIQKYCYAHSPWIQTISDDVYYSAPIVWWLGPLLGFGAIFGDFCESFIKRQIGIKPGHSWFPFDQIDYIIGGLLFSLFVVKLSVSQYLLIVVVWVALHLVTSYAGYLLHLKSKPI